MNLSKKTNAVILWVITIGLLVSMVIAFTPSLGNIFGGGNRQQSQPAVLVNGEPITELEVARAKSQNRIFSTLTEGQVGADLQLLLVDSLVQQEVLAQAAARTRVGGGEVRQAVKDWRERNGLAENDQRYLSVLRNVGLTDADFRAQMRSSLQQQQYLEDLVADVEVSDAEVQAFYQANRQSYTSEPKIRAREIVLDDPDIVADVYARLLSGEDFAAVAQDVSVENAKSGGALGAAEGTSEPAPVGAAALPTAVSSAAFALQAPGLTMPVASAGRTYIVKVEEYLPAAPQPFEEVEDEVRQDALDAKKQGLQQQKVQELREAATITIPAGSTVSYNNPVVATVGDAEIEASDLVEATYLNPQIQQFLSPDTASLVTNFFKPTILEQLIDTELAFQGAGQLDIDLVGPKSLVAQSARNYVSREATATPEDIQNYYDANPDAFTVPARAVATRVDFDSQAAAADFRKALVGQQFSEDALAAAAEAAEGELTTLGVVAPGSLPTELDTALFDTEAWQPLSGSSWAVSDVLVVSEEVEPNAAGTGGQATGGAAREQAQTGGAASGGAGTGGAEAGPQTRDVYVVMVAVRRPERVRPLEAVRPQVENAVLAGQRQELSDAWLDGLRDDIPVENLLQEANAAPSGTGGAATGGAATGGEATGGTVTGGAGTGGAPAAPAAGESGGTPE